MRLIKIFLLTGFMITIFLSGDKNILKKSSNKEYMDCFKRLDSLLLYDPNLANIEIQNLYNTKKNKSDNLSRLAYVNFYKMIADKQNSKFDSIPYLYERILLYIDKIEDKYLEARVNNFMGDYYLELGDFTKSIEYFFNAKNYFEKYDTTFSYLGALYNNLGKYYFVINDLEEAEFFFKKSFTLKKEHTDNEIATYYGNMGIISVSKGNLEMAGEYFCYSLNIYYKIGDVISITKGLINLAMTAVEANNFCAGLYYLNQISQEGYSHESLQSIVNNNYGYIYLHLKNYPLAIEHYLEGYKQAKSRKQVTEQLASLFYLSAIYDSIQKQDESYEFVKRYYILKDSIEGKEVIKDVEKIKWGSILKKHSSLQKNVNKVFTIIISLFLLILIVIYYLYRNKIKKIHLKIIENIKLRKYIKEKNKQHQQQLEHYSLEIETKNRELTVANLQLLEKSKTLNSIKKVISDEKYSSSSYPKEIHKVISHNENQDKDWNEFSDFLSKTHPEFFKKIQSEYNQLSKTEIRVCAYIRINMTNQEIANKLNISYRSIIKNRYRIKKKLGLNKDDNLDDFINMW